MVSSSTAQTAGFVLGVFAGLATGGAGFGLVTAGIQGMTLASLFADTKVPDGPRLEDTRYNDSSYGVSIPRVYATDQVTANIVWMKDNQLQERAEEVTIVDGIFSDTTQTQFKYYSSFAVVLCEGVIDNVNRIWANDEIIYDTAGGFGQQQGTLFKGNGGADIGLKTSFDIVRDFYGDLYAGLDSEALRTAMQEAKTKVRTYKGTLDQDPDPIIIENLGLDKASGFRGVAYIVFENLPLTNEKYNNALPTLRFEVTRTNLDLEAAQGDVRTFAARFRAFREDGTFIDNITLIDTNTKDVGSYMNSGSGTSGSNYFSASGTITELSNYAYSNGIIYNSTYNPDIPSGDRPTYNYKYIRSNGTVDTYLSRRPFLLFNQAHDVNNLTTRIGLNPLTEIKTATTLIKEDFVQIFPWDMQDTTEASTIYPILKPIMNLPDWFVVARGSSLQVGFIKSGRLVLFNTRLNLDEGYQDGEIDFRCNDLKAFSGAANGFDRDNSKRLCAAFLGGLVYIYMKPPPSYSAQYMYFSGLISLDISGLDGTELVDVIKLPSTSTTSLGVNTYLSETNVETYQFNKIEPYRFLDSGRVKWRKDLIVKNLGYDYEQDKLYTTYKISTSSGTEGPFVSDYQFNSTYINSPDILVKDPSTVYEINRATLETIQESYIIQGSVDPHTPIVFRVYEGIYADFAYNTYILTQDPDKERLYVVSGGNSYLDTYKTYTFDAEEGATLSSLLIQANEGQYLSILPEGVDSGSEKINLVSAYGTSGTNGSSNTTSPPFIAKTITTLNGDISSLYNPADGVQVGEIIAAEIKRSSRLDAFDDLDLSQLTDTVLGYSIKDRGSVKSITKALQDAYIFDLNEIDYKIQGQSRKGQPIKRVLTWEELGAKDSGGSAEEIKITTLSKELVPSRYNISYRDPSEQYEPNTLAWVDQNMDGEVSIDIKIPVALTYSDAYNLTQRIFLSIMSARRGNIEFSTSFKHSDIELGEYITLQTSDDNSYTVRVTSVDKGSSIVKCSAVIDNPANYSFEKSGLIDQVLNTEVNRKVASPLVIDSLPFLASQDDVGYWVGAYSINIDDIFSSVLSVTDVRQDSISRGKALINTTPVGYTTSSLGLPITEGDFDYRESIIFKPVAFEQGFIDSNESTVLQDQTTNTFFYGSKGKWEIIKIVNFVTNVDGTITGSGILRGYKGTSHYGQHKSGDMIVGINTGSLSKLNLGVDRLGMPTNVALQDPSPAPNSILSETVRGEGRLPLPPVKLGGYKKANGDFYIEWFRQARHTIEWVNSYEVPLDEQTQEYKVLIIDTDNDDLVVDEFIVQDVTNFDYDVSLQTSAFGSGVSELSFVVLQYSQELGTFGHPSELRTI